MNEKNNEIILFETHDQEVKLSVSLENETVWLSSNQMALLFDRDEKRFVNMLIMFLRKMN